MWRAVTSYMSPSLPWLCLRGVSIFSRSLHSTFQELQRAGVNNRQPPPLEAWHPATARVPRIQKSITAHAEACSPSSATAGRTLSVVQEPQKALWSSRSVTKGHSWKAVPLGLRLCIRILMKCLWRAVIFSTSGPAGSPAGVTTPSIPSSLQLVIVSTGEVGRDTESAKPAGWLWFRPGSTGHRPVWEAGTLLSPYRSLTRQAREHSVGGS